MTEKIYMDVKMSQTLSPVVIQSNSYGTPQQGSNTFSVLSTATPNVARPSVQMSSAVPLSATPLASARLTGLVAPNAPIVPVSTPVTVRQTVNTPIVPVTTSPIPSRSSPRVSMPPISVGAMTNRLSPSPLMSTNANMQQNQQRFSPSPLMSTNVNMQQNQQRVSTMPTQLTPRTIPPQRMSPRQVNTLSGSPVQLSVAQTPSSPNARSALLNLNNGASVSQPSITIPNITQPQGIISSRVNQESLLFPSIKVATPNSSLPFKPTAELMNKEFEVRDYQGIISNASIENELLNAGYAPLSKIVIRADNGDKRTQYIKAINKKGQKVFILLDVNGYTTARSTDLTLIEAHNASIVPYSLKTGAYECAGKDVCGVAFECGSDAVCVLARGTQDLTPKEANFVFVEQRAPAAATIETEGSIMSYPVIRLSEIRANPDLVLANTDIVTRRLRNNAYASELQELASAQQSINRLNAAFVRFENIRQDAAMKLNETLTQLEQWNNVYMSNPPTTDEGKDRYRKLQFNLAQRNEGIANLLRSMKKVADRRIEIDSITREINDITDFAEKEYANVQFAVSE